MASGLCPSLLWKTDWWIVALLNHQVFSRLLADFAHHPGLGQGKRVILVVDPASFHLTEKVQVPEGMHLVFLPSKSPELQPAERLWPLTNEVIAIRLRRGEALRSFASLDELEAVTCHRCRVLLNRRSLIRGLTAYHWWLEAVS